MWINKREGQHSIDWMQQ